MSSSRKIKEKNKVNEFQAIKPRHNFVAKAEKGKKAAFGGVESIIFGRGA